MRMEVKLDGSWRDLFPFDAEQAHEVEDAAASCARALGCDMRVVDDDGSTRYLNDRGVFRPLNDGGI